MIELSNVSLKYRMGNERMGSLKETVVRLLQGKLHFSDFWAIKDVTVKVNSGEVLGVIGLNGAGKSTLLKIISGVLPPTKGTVKVEGKISPLIELGAGFDHELSARENIFLNGAILGFQKNFLTKKFDEIIDYSELREFVDAPLRNFSSGMIARLAFAIATLVEPEVLIVDEILSVGDIHFQKKSEVTMRSLINGGATVVFVSHSLQTVREICDKVLWLDKGSPRAFGLANDICDQYFAENNQ